MNKFIGLLKTEETIQAKAEWKIEGFKDEAYRCNKRSLKFYRNNNVITCVFETHRVKAIGIAKCNPKDKFNYGDGVLLAELRARENLYKIAAEKHIKRMWEVV